MRAGLLRKTITIQEQIITKDSYGSNVSEWKDILSTRAEVKSNTGNRELNNGEIINTYTVTFTIRFYHNIKEQMRILHSGRKYRILSINKELYKQAVTIIGELINE